MKKIRIQQQQNEMILFFILFLFICFSQQQQEENVDVLEADFASDFERNHTANSLGWSYYTANAPRQLTINPSKILFHRKLSMFDSQQNAFIGPNNTAIGTNFVRTNSSLGSRKVVPYIQYSVPQSLQNETLIVRFEFSADIKCTGFFEPVLFSIFSE